MDAGVALGLGVVGVVVVAVVAWFVARRRVPADVVAEIAALAAELRLALGDVFDRSEVEQIAGWFYDHFATGSKYLTRARFIELVWRVLTLAKAQEPAMVRRVTVARDARSTGGAS